MPDPPALLIYADDLTGAADCAARWRRCGEPAQVWLTLPDCPPGAGATALAGDTRHLAPPEAAAAVIRMLRGVTSPAGARWYKKIDSTLRGNLGAELDAALAALGRGHALICPAFPGQGRGLQGGRLVCPPGVAGPTDLPARLAEQSRRAIATVSLDLVRAGPGRLAAQLASAARGASLIVCDALTDDDLTSIAGAADAALPDALLCGSAGLIGPLAAMRLGGREAPPPPAIPACARALVLVGSGSATAHGQIVELQRRYAGRVSVTRIDPELPGAPPAPQGDAPVALIHQPPPQAGAALDGPGARARSERLAAEVERLVARARPDLLALVGGDTAVALLRRLGVERLEILSELMPGIPLARAHRRGGDLLVALKAGSFGGPGALADLLDRCMPGAEAPPA